MICAQGPSGWCVAPTVQPFGEFAEDAGAAGAPAPPVSLEMDLVGTPRALSPGRLLSPQSRNRSRLRVTAPRSNWPVTLCALEEGGAGLCEAAMATGPFNEREHAVTNDIPEPIGYTANGQFAASLTVLHNSKQAERTHLSGGCAADQ